MFCKIYEAASNLLLLLFFILFYFFKADYSKNTISRIPSEISPIHILYMNYLIVAISRKISLSFSIIHNSINNRVIFLSNFISTLNVH
jgi:TRAP-type C4-dicarboxylate transport system permease small subunit